MKALLTRRTKHALHIENLRVVHAVKFVGGWPVKFWDRKRPVYREREDG